MTASFPADTSLLATAAKQDQQTTELNAIEAAVAAVQAAVEGSGGGSGSLPTGASTSANQSLILAAVEAVEAAVAAAAPLATQPVSGTVAVSNQPSGYATSAKQDSLLAAVAAVQTAVTAAGPLATQPVSAASLPLPSGAATAAKQDTLKTAVDAVATAVAAAAPLATQPVSGTVTVANPTTSPETGLAKTTDVQAVRDRLPTALTGGGALKTDASATTQPVSGTVAVSNPTDVSALATAAKQDTLKTAVDAVATAVAAAGPLATQPVSGTVTVSSAPTTAVTGPLTDTQLRATAVPVSDGGGSVTVDGTVAVSNFPATQPVSAAALPLPSGAATTAKQDAIISALPASPETGLAKDATLTSRLPSALVGGRLSVDASGVTQPVSASTLPLPSGAATESSLSAVNGKLPALSSSRVPVESAPVAAATTTGTITSGAGAVTLTAPANATQGLVVLTGTFSALLLVVGSTDGGSTYPFALSGYKGNAAAGTAPTNLLITSSDWLVAPLPPGITHIRVTPFSYTSGTVNVALNASAQPGTPSVNVGGAVALLAGTAAIGTVGVTSLPTPTAISVVTTASTNASSQKASAGTLTGLVVSNPTATAAYVKVYNKASAPTVGTDIPVMTVPAPVTAPGTPPTSVNLGPLGLRLGTGIALAVTAAAVATDTGNAVAGVQIIGAYV